MIYLVSACGSGEEFVAAFRRYADRAGLFVPMAEPIAVGRRGRFAVALRDGGVMIEGEAEVVSSSRTPTVLHGRPGMILRFVGPDEPSKTVLVELEKARLATQPPPPSVQPRPAEVPPAPRPVPPAAGGRIDAANALAECVAIGDVGALAAIQKEAPPLKAGPKFVVPTIPPVARPPGASSPAVTIHDEDSALTTLATLRGLSPGAQGAKPTEPPQPAPQPAPQPPAQQKPAQQKPQLPLPAPPRTDPVIAAQPEPELDAEPTTIAQTGPKPARTTGAQPTPELDSEPTTIAQTSPKPELAIPAHAPTLDSEPTTIAQTGPKAALSLPAKKPSPPTGAARSTGNMPAVAPTTSAARSTGNMPAVAPTTSAARSTGNMPAVAPTTSAARSTGNMPAVAPTTGAARSTGNMPAVAPPTSAARSTGKMAAIAPPAPAGRAPSSSEATPLPPPPGLITPPPDDLLLHVEISSEPTELSTIPIEAIASALKGPSVAAPASIELPTEPTVQTRPPTEPPPPPVTPRPPVVGVPASAPVRPPNVEEPTPSGDWTMIPGAEGPTIQPRTPARPRLESNPPGDWAISLDPKSSDGWSKPSSPALQPPPTTTSATAPAAPPAAPAATPPPAAATPPATGARAASAPAASATAAAPAAKAAPSRRSRPDPMPVVASTRLLESEPQRPIAEPPAEPKVQIDPTLIEPLVPLPEEPEPTPPQAPPAPPQAPPPNGSHPAMDAPMAASSSSGMRLQHMLTPVPGLMPPYAGPPYPPAPGQPPTPVPPLVDSAAASASMRYAPGARAPARASRRKRRILIAASAVVVIGAAAAALIVLFGRSGSGSEEAPPRPIAATRPAAGSAARAPSTAGSAAPAAGSAAPAAGSAAGSATPAESAAAAGSAASTPPAGQCAFDVVTVPAGAEVLSETGAALATTPGTLTLPCDVEVKLTFRRPRYVTVDRKYTPTAEGKPLKVALARPTYSIKVSSTPSGAAVSVGGRPQGVTPTTIRLPANEASTLTLSKDGFQADTQRFTPKQNNQAVHVTLQRIPRKVPR